ncbi:MAG: metalloregulator ArsR/SmtB family transcription factor [Defluviitaleaceae bacterium]|nr:metalloregulator ArsR/SmtB family transcription factor [Defluviitaleaceae bacterium]
MNEFAYTSDDFEEEAQLLKILGHPTRLCIVRGLIEKGGCNVSAMQQCLKQPQPTISQHLAKLKQAKIVATQRVGVEMIYRVENEAVIQLIRALF